MEVTRVVDSVVGVAGVGVGLVGASVDGRVGEGAGGLVVGIGVVMGRGVEEGEVSVDSCGSVSKKGLGITNVVRNIESLIYIYVQSAHLKEGKNRKRS